MKWMNIILIALSLLNWGCNTGSSGGKVQIEQGDAGVNEQTRSTLPELSIYNTNSVWQTQNADTLRLQDLRGKIRVVAMMYTNCQYTCPRLVSDMKAIESSLGDSARYVGLVLVSIDALHDTPEKLKSFALENKLAPDCLLLHGDENDILELAALLGVQYRRSSETDFTHSNVLSVLNEEGEIVYQQNGLGLKAETVLAIKKLVAREHLAPG